MDGNEIENRKYRTRTTSEVKMLKINASELRWKSVRRFHHLNICFLSLFLVSQGGNKHSLQASFFQKSELCQHRSQRNGTMTELFSSRPTYCCIIILRFLPCLHDLIPAVRVYDTTDQNQYIAAPICFSFI